MVAHEQRRKDMTMSTSAQWVRDLRQSVQRLGRPALSACGTVLVALEVDDHQIERASILLTADAIRVVDRVETLADLPMLFVQGRLTDWLKYLAEPTLSGLMALRLYGDTSLLTCLTESEATGGLLGFRVRQGVMGRTC